MKKIFFIFCFLLSNFLYGEYFLPINDNIILEKETYTICYSTNYNHCIWVEYTLTSNQLYSTSVRRTDDFRCDYTLTNYTCNIIQPSIYSKSGYDKGHLIPAQDRSYSKESVSETFLMSNMSPQDPSFNRGIWKQLENYTRECAIKNGEVRVITGPIFFNKHFMLDNVAVPNMYFKIIIFNKYKLECYLLPNQKSNLNFDMYKVDLQYIKALLQ